jgi:hypothetical protein
MCKAKKCHTWLYCLLRRKTIEEEKKKIDANNFDNDKRENMEQPKIKNMGLCHLQNTGSH